MRGGVGEVEGPGFKCMSPDSKRMESESDMEGFENNVHGKHFEKMYSWFPG